jgi:hypothetical protein
MKRKYKWIIAFSTVIPILAFSYYELTQAHKEFLESKYVRETTATVIRKEDFRADQNNRFYVSGYGDRVEMQPGEEQKRVYYQIDTFGQLVEPRLSRVIDAERRRIEEFGPRFTYAVGWYEEVKPGDKIQVSYRAFSDGHIQVWSADRVKEVIHVLK